MRGLYTWTGSKIRINNGFNNNIKISCLTKRGKITIRGGDRKGLVCT